MLKKKFFIFAGLLAAGCAVTQTPNMTLTQQQKTPPSTTSANATMQAVTQSVVQNLNLPVSTVGHVSRHAQNFVGQLVRIQGFVLQKEPGYVIISDEASGSLGFYDLPVTGLDTSKLQLKGEYIFYGTLVYQGLTAINKNPYHLELLQAPESFHQT